MSEPIEPKPFGSALMRELLGVHSVLRRDLEVVRGLARSVSSGAASATQAREGVEGLESSSPIWQLKIGCMHYCRFVHGHHGFEDGAWFPALRKAGPEVGPVIDKLEDDHRRISDLTDDVSAAVDGLDRADTPATRSELSGALETLASSLLEHLDYEERALAPTLVQLEEWPR